MAEHDCIQEKELGELRSSVSRFGKEIFGNGKEGLSTTVPKLTVEVANLKDSIDDLRTAISGLNRFMNEERGSKSAFKNAAPWVSIMVAVIAIAVSVIVKVNFSKENERINNVLQWKQDRTPDSATRSLTPEQVKEMNKKKNATVQ